jgi:hypothetical protein
MSNEQIQEEFEGWIPDLGFSRTRDTTICRLTELYWMNKTFYCSGSGGKGPPAVGHPP